MTSESNKKIAKNTLFLYFRMFLTMGVSLYTSRVILAVLGFEDYGIYSLVGGIVALLAFLNMAMSSASQRFLSIDIGRQDWVNLHKTFNVAFIIHLGIACIVVFVAETIGLWFLNYKLVIPASRILQTNFVYQFSILASVITITQVPFNALIIARERMSIFAIISILEVLLKLAIVYLLFVSPFDRLQSYAVLLVIVSIITSSVYKIYTLKNFKETRFTFFRDITLYKPIISYSGWNLVGNIAWVAKGQGVNILLNLFFGPLVNAAYGIMLQVQSAVGTFVQNFQIAINPQIYKSYGTGDTIHMQKIMFQGSKLTFFLMLLLVLPVIYNVHFILIWWLKTPPAFTEIFVVLTLINLLVESISWTLVTGCLATGNIKWYQIIVGTTLFLNLPVSYILFKIYANPLIFLYVAIPLSVLTLVFRLFFLKRMIHLDILFFVKEVIFPVALISILSIGCIITCNLLIGTATTLIELIAGCFFLIAAMGVLIIIFGLKKKERSLVFNLIKEKAKK